MCTQPFVKVLGAKPRLVVQRVAVLLRTRRMRAEVKSDVTIP